jgi:hypothetical protein
LTVFFQPAFALASLPLPSLSWAALRFCCVRPRSTTKPPRPAPLQVGVFGTGAIGAEAARIFQVGCRRTFSSGRRKRTRCLSRGSVGLRSQPVALPCAHAGGRPGAVSGMVGFEPAPELSVAWSDRSESAPERSTDRGPAGAAPPPSPGHRHARARVRPIPKPQGEPGGGSHLPGAWIPGACVLLRGLGVCTPSQRPSQNQN